MPRRFLGNLFRGRFDNGGGFAVDFRESKAGGGRFMIRNSAAKVVNDALSLPAKSRAKLAEKLLESLDDPRQEEIDRLWAEEAEDRIDAFERSDLKAIPGKEVFRRLKHRKND